MPIRIVFEQAKVDSPPGYTNWRDRIIAWVTSAVVAIFGLVCSLWTLVVAILDSVADYVLPYLQSVPQQDKPVWIAAVTFIVMGLIILNKRKSAGAGYMPPMLPPSVTPGPSTPVPQGQPLPPGAPVNTTTSAF